MPIMNGEETTKRLRKMNERDSLKLNGCQIVVHSAGIDDRFNWKENFNGKL